VRQLPKVLPTRVWGRAGHQSRPTWHRARVVDRSRPPLSVLSAIEIVQGLSRDNSRSSVDSPHWLFRPLSRFQGAPGDQRVSRHTPITQDGSWWRRWCPQPDTEIRSNRTCRWAGAHA